MRALVYFTTGTPGVDADSPDMPVQGLQVGCAETESDWQSMGLSDKWVSVMRDSQGNPALGYKAAIVDRATALVWANRIKRAGENYPAPYTDADGDWYPGAIGLGLSVVDAPAHAVIEALHAAASAKHREDVKNSQSVSPRQAREWLILNDLDEALEARILAIGDTGDAASIKQAKLMWNWYEKADSWVYGNAHLIAMCNALGVDRDKFFDEASKL